MHYSCLLLIDTRRVGRVGGPTLFGSTPASASGARDKREGYGVGVAMV